MSFNPTILEISINDNVLAMFNEIFSSVTSAFLVIVIILYFVGLSLSFLKNI